jgi:hypothetical protein
MDTVPGKWFSDVTVMVDGAGTPTFAATCEVAVKEKSRNWKVAVELWIRGELVPMIVAV